MLEVSSDSVPVQRLNAAVLLSANSCRTWLVRLSYRRTSLKNRFDFLEQNFRRESVSKVKITEALRLGDAAFRDLSSSRFCRVTSSQHSSTGSGPDTEESSSWSWSWGKVGSKNRILESFWGSQWIRWSRRISCFTWINVSPVLSLELLLWFCLKPGRGTASVQSSELYASCVSESSASVLVSTWSTFWYDGPTGTSWTLKLSTRTTGAQRENRTGKPRVLQVQISVTPYSGFEGIWRIIYDWKVFFFFF